MPEPPAPAYQRIATTIRVALTAAGKTQAQLADAIPLPRSSLSERMTGLVDWRVGELYRAALFLEIPVAALFLEPETSPTPAA